MISIACNIISLIELHCNNFFIPCEAWPKHFIIGLGEPCNEFGKVIFKDTKVDILEGKWLLNNAFYF